MSGPYDDPVSNEGLQGTDKKSPTISQIMREWDIKWFADFVWIDYLINIVENSIINKWFIQLGKIRYSINKSFSAWLATPKSCFTSAPSPSKSPQLLFILSLIWLIISLGGNLAWLKANKIFPLELLEPGTISLVFQVTLLFFNELAAGMDLQSSTIKSLWR